MVTPDISNSSKKSEIRTVFQGYLSVSYDYEKRNEYSYLRKYIYLRYNKCDEEDSKSKQFSKLNTTVCQFCSKRLLSSVSCFRITTFDPVRQRVSNEDSYYLLSYKS